MSAVDSPSKKRLYTVEELLAMPNDGVERWLINGELREGKSVTRRNFRHSFLAANITEILKRWVREKKVGGAVLTGDAGFRILDNPPTTVGIDVAYISKELAARVPIDTYLIEGVPTLAVEILSPSDQQDEVFEKIDAYLKAGVKLVWLVEPIHQTITVYRPDREPSLYTLSDTINNEPNLPGFDCKVAELLEIRR